MKILRLQIVFSFLLLSACSVYESGGREAIETDQNEIVTGTFDKTLTHYTSCGSLTTLPDFLKAPLEVIQTPYEAEDISILYNSQATPRWLVAYRYSANLSRHQFCKVYSLDGLRPKKSKIISAARIGVENLKNL